MEQQEPNFTKGFNQGYKLRLYSPELFELLKDSLTEENEFQKGVLAGAAQADVEKEQSRNIDLENLRKGKEPEQEIER